MTSFASAQTVGAQIAFVNALWLSLLLFLTLPRSLAAEPTLPTLIFAPLPLENPASTQARNQPLADLLARTLQRPVDMRLYPDHASLLDALDRGEIDLAELGPLPFLLARDRRPDLHAVVSLLEPDGQASYRCMLVAPVDGLRSLAPLATGEHPPRIALTRAESTCGTTVSFWLLAEQGIEPSTVEAAYLGGHDEVALAVLRQRFSIGGVKDSVAQRFHALGLRVLATSAPVPGFVLAARSDLLTEPELTALTETLINLSDTQRAGLQNGHFGFTAFDARLFDRVEAMRRFSAPCLERLAD